MISENRKFALMFKALQTLVIVLALPNAIPRSN